MARGKGWTNDDPHELVGECVREGERPGRHGRQQSDRRACERRGELQKMGRGSQTGSGQSGVVDFAAEGSKAS